MTTETLDKFYLEWSQFTVARTQREIAACDLLRWLDRKGGLGGEAHGLIRAVIDQLASKPTAVASAMEHP